MAVATYTKTGTKATTTAKLDKAVFAVEISNHDLLKRAYVAYLSNARDNYAQVKTRGEVRGGGKKPWKQKGTGRARFGSSRNPIWRGGGITFGPTGEENYTKKLPTATKRVAIRQALTMAAQENKLSIIESLSFKDNKTSEAATLLKKLGLKKRILIVDDAKTEAAVLAVRNLQQVELVSAKYVNVYDVLNADHILMTTKALQVIHQWLGTAGGEK